MWAKRKGVQLPRTAPLLELSLVCSVGQLQRRVEGAASGGVPLHQKNVAAPALPQVRAALPQREVERVLPPDAHDTLVYRP